MGYANRSRLDDALGLDAQSRRVRFSSARRRGDSNSDTNSKPIGYTYIHTYTDSDANCDTV